MDELTDFLIKFISRQDNPVGLAVLGAAALIEYVVPPFPGDSITLFGAVLITAYGWSFWGVFAAVMLGSTLGSMGVFYLGGHWQKRRSQGAHGKAAIDRLIDKFHRYGAAWLIINRFLPGIRSLVFVAAGMAGMQASAVIFYSVLSAALWNLCLIALGSLLGANFEMLLGLVRQYTLIVLSAAAVLVGLLAARALWRRFRTRGQAEPVSAGSQASDTSQNPETSGEPDPAAPRDSGPAE